MNERKDCDETERKEADNTLHHYAERDADSYPRIPAFVFESFQKTEDREKDRRGDRNIHAQLPARIQEHRRCQCYPTRDRSGEITFGGCVHDQHRENDREYAAKSARETVCKFFVRYDFFDRYRAPKIQWRLIEPWIFKSSHRHEIA